MGYKNKARYLSKKIYCIIKNALGYNKYLIYIKN